MKMKRVPLALLLLTGVMGYASAPLADTPNQPKGVKPGVIGAMPLDANGTFCHLRFPAIQARTLGTDDPQLKASTTADVIDYYGPCDHDPLGKDEVQSQIRLNDERQQDLR
jgi:hypothetical protein